MTYQPIDKFKNMNHSSRLIYDRVIIQKPYELIPSMYEFDFGQIQPDHIALHNIEIKNTGYLPLERSPDSVTCVGYGFDVTHDAPLILKPGEHFSLEAQVQPTITEKLTGGLYIKYGPVSCFIKLEAWGV